MFELIGTPVEKDMWETIAMELDYDIAVAVKAKETGKFESISLLAKWLPTETASSANTRKLARKCIKNLGMTPRQYRKMLSALRKYLKVVETSMSAKEWDKIQYEQVPSYAMKNYRKAFARNDADRFSAYQTSLVKGEAKINASTLFPYDLVHQYMAKGRRSYGACYDVDTIVEAQWKALPNYVEGENNILVMADVSGSMSGRPMETSIGLATYFAQHATSDYHNLYMTFTDRPHFVSLDGCETLYSAIRKVASTNVGYSTNLSAAFKYILNHAITNNIKPEDMPKALVVISDMEIDPYFHDNKKFDFIQKVKADFAAHNYVCPKIVLWNVEARNDTFLTQSDDVILVSGQSTSVFKNLCANLNGKTSWDLMLEVLNDKIYDCIKV